MTQDNYRNIPELLATLQERAEKLSNGSLPAEELNVMLNETRELYERLIVLQYKAFENEVKQNEAPTAIEEESPKRNTIKPADQEGAKPAGSKPQKRSDQGKHMNCFCNIYDIIMMSWNNWFDLSFG